MIFSQYHLKLFKIPTQGKNWLFLIHLLRTFSMFYTTHVLLVLTSFHKTVKQTLPLVREPVACHGCHCSHEHRGVDQISFSSQCGQNTEEHPKKHLLQHLHLIILNVLKQTFVLETCRRNKTRLLAKPNQEDGLFKCSIVSGQEETHREVASSHKRHLCGRIRRRSHSGTSPQCWYRSHPDCGRQELCHCIHPHLSKRQKSHITWVEKYSCVWIIFKKNLYIFLNLPKHLEPVSL